MWSELRGKTHNRKIESELKKMVDSRRPLFHDQIESLTRRSKRRSTVCVFDALVGKQPPCENWSYFIYSRFDVAHEANSLEDQLKPHRDMSIVDLSIFLGGDTQDGDVLVQRVTYSAVESGQGAVAAY